MNTIRTRLAAMLAVLLLASLVHVPASRAAEAAAPAQAAPAAAAVPDDYMIGPGDTLQIFVWRNPELTVTIPVRPDGRITSPLVQDMVAVGKTPSTLSRDIETVLAEFVRSPQVNVIVTTSAGMLSQVKAVGEVRAEQSYPFRHGMKVLDLLLAAGGMTDYAAGNKAKIVRTENGKTKEIAVKLDNLVNRGDMKQNLPLQAGDILIVPESWL